MISPVVLLTTTTSTTMNETTAESTVIINSTVTATTATEITNNATDPLSCDDSTGVTCSVTLGSGDPVMCARLAPPPVPPWLEDSPARLHELTRHCRSWTLYHELCPTGSGNSTLKQPRQDDTEVTVLESGTPGIQWVIPALALIVVLLLVILATVMYKYYSRSNKRSMYRVAGSGRPFKLPQTTTSWAGGPLVESETMESYLCQHEGGGADMRYTRSPVCRLLEQIQYVATPTEDQTRPRGQSGPPAFTSPAYFLPSLSWLRLPVLQHAWPRDNNSSGGGGGGENSQGNTQGHIQGQGQSQGQTTQYDAGRTVCSHNGEVTHQFPVRESDGGEEENNADNEPEYSEIWEGGPFGPGGPFHGVPFIEPPDGCSWKGNQWNRVVQTHTPSHYSSLSQVPYHPASQQSDVCECQDHGSANGIAGYEMDYMQQHLPTHHRGHHIFSPSEHRYEQLWPCGEECGGGSVPHAPLSPHTSDTCENEWLSRYKLPSPCLNTPDHNQTREREMFSPNHTHAHPAVTSPEDLTSDSELLPEHPAESPPAFVRPDRRSVTDGHGGRAGGRVEVKYRNPMFEGQGRLVPSSKSSDSGPALSRFLGLFGLNKR